MSKWPTVPLGDVLRVSGEKIEPAAQPSDVFNYVGLEHIEGHTGNLLPRQSATGAELLSTKNVFRAGQILYGKLRPYLNKVHLADSGGICSTDILVLDADRQRLSAAFATLYLRTPIVLSATANLTAGANLPRIDAKAFLGIPIPIPPLAEQDRIVRLLDEAAALRRLRTQANERTAATIPALFDEVFGHPATNPKGWPFVTLGEISQGGQYGLNAAALPDGSAGIRFIRITDIDETGKLGRCDPAYVSSETPGLGECELGDGDVLIARSGATAGKSYVHQSTRERSVFAGYLIRFQLDHDRILPSYMGVFLQTAAYWAQLNSHKRAVAQPNVNAKQLASIRLPLPPIALQRTFAARVAEVRALEAEQVTSRKRLDDLYQSLLHRAFSGDL